MLITVEDKNKKFGYVSCKFYEKNGEFLGSGH